MTDIKLLYKYLIHKFGITLPDYIMVPIAAIFSLILLAMFFVAAYNLLSPPIKKILKIIKKQKQETLENAKKVTDQKKQSLEAKFRQYAIDKITPELLTKHNIPLDFGS